MAVVRKRTVQPRLVLEDFLCSICREIFKSPRQLPCSHIFCKECLQNYKVHGTNQICPYCRKSFSPLQEIDAYEVENKIKSGTSECCYCNEEIPLRRMQDHLNECCDKQLDGNVSAAINKILPDSRQKEKLACNLPVATGFGVIQNQRRNNLRSTAATFDCPYCSVRKLGRESLLQHVLSNHKGEDPHVVCPICAAMPWGNKNQKSQNFPKHLKIRHQFDYDFFVDMNKDEDAVYKETLEKSMYDQGRFV